MRDSTGEGVEMGGDDDAMWVAMAEKGLVKAASRDESEGGRNAGFLPGGTSSSP